MADTKISAMTPLLAPSNAVEIPVVSTLLNFKCTKSQFFVGAAGENLQMMTAAGQFVALTSSANGATVKVDDAGTISVIGTGIGFLSGIAAFCNMGMSGVGAWFVNVAPGQTAYMGDAGVTCFVNVDLTLGQVFVTCPNGASVSYAVAVPANWAFPPPVTMQAALDRCAALLAFLNGGVGP